jgi:hypothetical protein
MRSAGENCVWGAIGLYQQHGDAYMQFLKTRAQERNLQC